MQCDHWSLGVILCEPFNCSVFLYRSLLACFSLSFMRLIHTQIPAYIGAASVHWCKPRADSPEAAATRRPASSALPPTVRSLSEHPIGGRQFSALAAVCRSHAPGQVRRDRAGHVATVRMRTRLALRSRGCRVDAAFAQPSASNRNSKWDRWWRWRRRAAAAGQLSGGSVAGTGSGTVMVMTAAAAQTYRPATVAAVAAGCGPCAAVADAACDTSHTGAVAPAAAVAHAAAATAGRRHHVPGAAAANAACLSVELHCGTTSSHQYSAACTRSGQCDVRSWCGRGHISSDGGRPAA